MSNKEIARDLGLGEGTVKIHVAALGRKLHLKTRTAIAAAGARMRPTSPAAGLRPHSR
jgi:DNA-binding NarL/FixJ family response regulator